MVSNVDEKPAAQTHERRTSIISWVIGLILLVLLGSFIGVRLADNASRSVKVPSNIVQTFSSPIYLPNKLPGNYEIDEDSFMLQENVLIFQAKDDAGGTIVFTEQPKPAEVNFENFYAQQFKDAETLDNMPYPSVVGKSTVNNGGVLSIVTEDTWVIASTQSPITSDSLKIIAEHLTRYDEK